MSFILTFCGLVDTVVIISKLHFMHTYKLIHVHVENMFRFDLCTLSPTYVCAFMITH